MIAIKVFWLTVFPEIRGNIGCHAEVLVSLGERGEGGGGDRGEERGSLSPDWTAVLGSACPVPVM